MMIGLVLSCSISPSYERQPTDENEMWSRLTASGKVECLANLREYVALGNAAGVTLIDSSAQAPERFIPRN